MYLQRLCLLNFKNIEVSELEFSRGLNCFVGDNGTGKTNLLDSIYYLSLCKSAFGLSDAQCVRHGSTFFQVEGSYVREGMSPDQVCCGFKRGGGKQIRCNGKEYGKLSEHVGVIPVVLVSPYDTNLINESGEDRRRYLNAVISQLDRVYLGQLIRYNQLLAERNKLFKMRGEDLAGVLEVLDERLSGVGTAIYERRSEMVAAFEPLVAKYYGLLSNDRETVSIAYKSDLATVDFRTLLDRNRERDRLFQYTTGGVHRDDLVLQIGDYPIRKYGSQGQQKSFLIALKLAQFEVIAAQSRVKPLLLFDDIFDKLDLQRVKRLLQLVSDERFGQIFITDSNKVRLEGIFRELERPWKLFGVSEGVIREEPR